MMEPLWSPVVATGGNQWQIESPRKRQRQAKTVAAGCDQLPFGAHGKEGVDGSSPSEGFRKRLQNGVLLCLASSVPSEACPSGSGSSIWAICEPGRTPGSGRCDDPRQRLSSPLSWAGVSE